MFISMNVHITLAGFGDQPQKCICFNVLTSYLLGDKLINAITDWCARVWTVFSAVIVCIKFIQLHLYTTVQYSLSTCMYIQPDIKLYHIMSLGHWTVQIAGWVCIQTYWADQTVTLTNYWWVNALQPPPSLVVSVYSHNITIYLIC